VYRFGANAESGLQCPGRYVEKADIALLTKQSGFHRQSAAIRAESSELTPPLEQQISSFYIPCLYATWPRFITGQKNTRVGTENYRFKTDRHVIDDSLQVAGPGIPNLDDGIGSKLIIHTRERDQTQQPPRPRTAQAGSNRGEEAPLGTNGYGTNLLLFWREDKSGPKYLRYGSGGLFPDRRGVGNLSGNHAAEL
jgi:hypothetical protein